MFDYLRNITKSSAEKRQEQLAAYVDGELSSRERQQFEALLAQDRGLQADLAQQQAIRQRLRQAPRRRVPRNFTLDPAVYGAPDPQPLFRLYPVLQTATALAAVMLVLVLGLDFLGGGLGQMAESAPVAQVEMEAAEPAMAEVAESSVEESIAEEMVVEEEMAADEVADAVSEEAAIDTFSEAEAIEGDVPAAAPPNDDVEIQTFGEAPLATPTPSSPPREAEPTLAARVAATAVSDVAANEAAAVADEGVAETAVQPAPSSSPWLGWQIALALAFVVLLILTLIVRQRVR